jgi:hypothetical protein
VLIIDLSVRAKAMELLEEDTKENFSDFGFGKSDIKT